MNNVRGSWHFKLDRAETHLVEVNEAIARYAETRPYRAARDLETDPDPKVYVVAAHLAEQPDFTLATILGEFFYNLRSALDHLAIAISPPNRRKRNSFPICLFDPWRPGAKSGRLAESEKITKARTSFKDSTRGMSGEAVAAIKGLQPYQRGSRQARLHHLAILDSLAQADKHRELVTVARHLSNPATTVTFKGSDALFSQVRPGVYQDGAIVAVFPFMKPVVDSEVEVHVHGAVEVGVKLPETRADFVLPGTLTALLGYFKDVVIPTLEPLI